MPESVKYLDSKLEYSVPEVAKTYSISYRGASYDNWYGHDHSDVFTNRQTEAKAGDSVDVFATPSFDATLGFGITDTSVKSIDHTSKSQLQQYKETRLTGHGGAPIYTFTMPNENVIVWVYCPDDSLAHAVV